MAKVGQPLSYFNSFQQLCLLNIPSALPFLHLADFPEASDRVLKTESGYEEGITWGASFYFEPQTALFVPLTKWSSRIVYSAFSSVRTNPAKGTANMHFARVLGLYLKPPDN